MKRFTWLCFWRHGLAVEFSVTPSWISDQRPFWLPSKWLEGRNIASPPRTWHGHKLIGGIQGKRCLVDQNLWLLGFNLGWLRCYFPQDHSTVNRQTRFNLNFIPGTATFTNIECKGPSQHFGSGSNKWRPHNPSLYPSNKTIIDNAATSPPDFAYCSVSPQY